MLYTCVSLFGIISPIFFALEPINMNGPVPSSHLDDSAGIQTVDDFASEEEFLSAVDDSIRYFSEGDLITGKVVRVDRDEVLVDVSYKTEGVINQKELSVRSNVVPSDLVQVGMRSRPLCLSKRIKMAD